MIPNLVYLLSGRPVPTVAHSAFVEVVRIPESEPRSIRVERLILVCWLLIAVKHVLVLWAVHHYHVPFHSLWVNFPTWLLGLLATSVYCVRVRR